MPTTITNRLRVCVTVLRDLFEATDRFEYFQLLAPSSIDILTVHLIDFRKVASVCFDPFNNVNVIADLPSVEMDGRTSLSVHEATYAMLEKAHARLTIRFAGFSQLDSAERRNLIGGAIPQVLESLKTLPHYVWSDLEAELRKEEIRVQEFTATSLPQRANSIDKELTVASAFQILADGNVAIERSTPAMSHLNTDLLADLAIDRARIREEAAVKEWQNQSILNRLEAAWDNIYVLSPSFGKPEDYAQWSRNLLAFARVAKEVGYSELFLKALPTRDDERNALSLIQAAILGGENAIQSRLLELESPSADREWKTVFIHSSLFLSTVRPKHVLSESGGSLVEKPVEVSSVQSKSNADTATDTREKRIAALDIRHKHAILAFELAEKAIASPGERFTREKAWVWVEEHYEDYRFPSKQAFMDYVTQARGKLGENVNQPRGGRSGRSVVRQSEI